MNSTITIQTTVNAPIEKVWHAWTTPEHIIQWNFASDDWQCPRAQNDLRVGGRFSARMEAKDGSMGFDFEGEYTDVIPHQRIAYTMDDGREVVTNFAANGTTTQITGSFVPESENPPEMQREGWQSILDNFRKHVESL